MAIRIQITIVLVIIFQVQGIGPNPLFTILILTLDMIAAHNNEHYIALIQHLSHGCYT